MAMPNFVSNNQRIELQSRDVSIQFISVYLFTRTYSVYLCRGIEEQNQQRICA